MNKIHSDASAARDGLLFDGWHLWAGGFGLCGIPERSTNAIYTKSRAQKMNGFDPDPYLTDVIARIG